MKPDYDFAHTRAFPFFVARAVRWLASERLSARWLAAGSTRSDWQAPLQDAGEQRLDPVGAAFALPTAGLYRDAGGSTLAASLLDPASTTPAAARSHPGRVTDRCHLTAPDTITADRRGRGER